VLLPAPEGPVRDIKCATAFLFIQMEFSKESSRSADTEDGVSLKNDLYFIYKAIRRHLGRTMMKPHRKCVENYGRSSYWDKNTLTCKGRICEVANAFLLWRMYFEEVNHPIYLFQKFRPSRKRYGNNSPIRWEQPKSNLPIVIAKKIFSLECYWVFLECLQLSKGFQRDDVYSFNYQSVKGYNVPHWIAENSDEIFKIHWWERIGGNESNKKLSKLCITSR
jgi:hypothetical protein